MGLPIPPPATRITLAPSSLATSALDVSKHEPTPACPVPSITTDRMPSAMRAKLSRIRLLSTSGWGFWM